MLRVLAGSLEEQVACGIAWPTGPPSATLKVKEGLPDVSKEFSYTNTPATGSQVREWAKEHNLGNPASGLWVWAQADEE